MQRGRFAPADVAAIEAGMDKYAVLVLPGQDLTDEQQLEFTKNFQVRCRWALIRPSCRPTCACTAFADTEPRQAEQEAGAG